MVGSTPPETCGNPDCQTQGMWTTICPLLVPLPDTWELTEMDRLILVYLRISPE